MKKIFAFVSLFIFLISSIPFFTMVNANENTQILETQSYKQYIGEKIKNNITNKIISCAITSSKLNDSKIESYLEKSKAIIMKNENSSAEFDFSCDKQGKYNVFVEYASLTDTIKPIEIKVDINNTVPFFEANSILLPRVFKNDKDSFVKDSKGNDIRPKQVQVSCFKQLALFNEDNSRNDVFYFEFNKGVNSIKFTLLNGELAISKVWVGQVKTAPDYKGYIAGFEQRDVVNCEGIVIQGEDANLKSDNTLFPITDRTSPVTQPFDEAVDKLNIIGGTNWSYPAQLIEWEFDIQKTGFYTLDIRERQNQLNGMQSIRTIYIDDEVPFSQMNNYGFSYNRSWVIDQISDKDSKEPYKFYFTQGKHKIGLEVSTGEFGEILDRVSKTIVDLNDVYKNIIMVTGTTVDPYRDYSLDKTIPGLITTFKGIANDLDSQMKNIQTFFNSSATQAMAISQMSTQLKSMADKPQTIAQRMSNYYSNLSALSAWLLAAKKQPLDIDYIRIKGKTAKNLPANANVFESLISMAKSFYYSFFANYNEIGKTNTSKKPLSVWVGIGEDQAQTLKRMIDQDFTIKTGIPVKLNLVQGSLMEATVAGKGPDIALNVGMSQPVDYAARGILAPLSGFSDFSSIIKQRFYNGATTPFVYDGKTYALPETQEFNMLFYRTDIFKELGLTPPDTWDDLKALIPVLTRKNMDVGIQTISQTVAGQVTLDLPKIFPTLLLQNGIDLYSNDFSKTNLASNESINIFKNFTDLYVKYGLPLYFDFANRFRTGEMPIGISSISMYNYLDMSAPEIKNRWDMTFIPGTRNSGGLINRSTEFSGISSVMFTTCKEQHDGWEFLKWWTSDQTQADYGLELESLMGVAGRYMTANKNAFEQIPWSTEIAKKIKIQWSDVKPIPQVVGSYFISRSLINAITQVVVYGDNPRDTIEKATLDINTELMRKKEQLNKILKK